MPELARAVLWDMDGTLVDSSDKHWRAWRDTLAADGFMLTHEQFAATFGQRNDTILRGLLGDELSDAAIARIGDAKEAEYRRLVRAEGIVVLPGVIDWVTVLQAGGWRQAIASAAPRANIDTILAVLGLDEFFAAITAAEDVTAGKPDPQVYLLAASRVDTPPARCIVVEDAPAGLEGARRGGMACIGVRTHHSQLAADIVVDRLDQLPPDSFERLVA